MKRLGMLVMISYQLLANPVHLIFAKEVHTHQMAQAWISDGLSLCPFVIKVKPNKAITLQFTDDLQFAVPSEKSILTIHLKKHTAVIQLKEDQVKYFTAPIHISFILNNQRSFHCTFAPIHHASSGRVISVLVIQSKSLFHQTMTQVLNLLKLYSLFPNLKQKDLIDQWPKIDTTDKYSHANQITTEMHRSILHIQQQNHIRSRLQWLSNRTWKQSAEVPIRTQNHFIYATITEIFQTHDSITLRIALQNRTQDPFILKKVYVEDSHHSQPVGSHQADLSFWPQQVVLKADRAIVYIATNIPKSLLTHKTKSTRLILQGTRNRQLYFKLTDFYQVSSD